MPAYTSRLSLQKPGGGSTGAITPGEVVDIDVINTNMDKIDANLGAPTYTSTTRPAAPMAGMLIWESDTRALARYEGGTWTYVGGSLGYFHGTASTGVAAATSGTVTALTRDATLSQSDSWIDLTTTSTFTLQPGVYQINHTTTMTPTATGRTYADIGDTGGSGLARGFSYVGDTVSSAAYTARVAGVPKRYVLRVFQTTGGTTNVASDVTIARIAAF